MKCAGHMADLDQLKRSLEDLKRTTARITKPMDDAERRQLSRSLAKLPRVLRPTARWGLSHGLTRRPLSSTT